MKYLVYLTHCISNNKIYVGVHETVDPNVFDGYLGNGVYTTRPASYKKAQHLLKQRLINMALIILDE